MQNQRKHLAKPLYLNHNSVYVCWQEFTLGAVKHKRYYGTDKLSDLLVLVHYKKNTISVRVVGITDAANYCIIQL